MSRANRFATLKLRDLPTLYLLTLLLLFSSRSARADGPHIAFHGTTDGYTITLFSAPDPLVAGPVHLTLLVQNATDGALATPATAEGRLALPGQPPVTFTLTPGGDGGNRRLLGTTVTLPAPGDYALALTVAGPGSSPARFSGALPVAKNNGRRNTVLWAVFMPVVLVLLFLTNQHAKQQLRRARAQASSAHLRS